MQLVQIDMHERLKLAAPNATLKGVTNHSH